MFLNESCVGVNSISVLGEEPLQMTFLKPGTHTLALTTPPSVCVFFSVSQVSQDVNLLRPTINGNEKKLYFLKRLLLLLPYSKHKNQQFLKEHSKSQSHNQGIKLGSFGALKLAMLILVLQFLLMQCLLQCCICLFQYAIASKSAAFAEFSTPNEPKFRGTEKIILRYYTKI